MFIQYIGLSLLLLISGCIEGMTVSLDKKKSDDEKIETPLLKIPINLLPTDGQEKLSTVADVDRFLKRERSVVHSARKRTTPVTAEKREHSQTASFVEQEQFVNTLTLEDITEISQQCHIAPEVLIQVLCAQYKVEESKIPRAALVEGFKNLRAQDKLHYQELQKVLLEKLHEVQKVQESNSSRGSGDEKNDTKGSVNIPVLPDTLESVLHLIKDVKRDKHDPLAEIFTKMMIDQHDQKAKQADWEAQKSKIHFLFAIGSGLLAFVQTVGWPMVITILRITNHTNVV